jgi:hypothetical protein
MRLFKARSGVVASLALLATVGGAALAFQGPQSSAVADSTTRTAAAQLRTVTTAPRDDAGDESDDGEYEQDDYYDRHEAHGDGEDD